MHFPQRLVVPAALLVSLSACAPAERRIRVSEYEDKVYAAWLGQCIGNMYGLAHEFKYNEEPRTEPISGWADETLKAIREYNGAYSDDDTDIEYVDLFCMEKYGPEPTYEDITEFWKLCINRYIWVANRSARELMDRGYLPPLTGRRGLNHNWYQIDPQLVCEIWAVTAPGMLDYAAAKADWAAKVTNDDYGTHPTIWYNTMYAAAFFESDPRKLCQIGYERLPERSVFRQAIDDVRTWKAQHGQDWVAVRKKIKEKYLKRQGLPEGIVTSPVGALLNGTLGVLALLYGEGDLEKTMNMACMAGYDADNQCATLAGLIALAKGSKSIPREYTHVLDTWTLPLNDSYKNRTRDHLPDGKLTDMAARTAKLGRDLVLAKGGRIEGTGDSAVMIIDSKARFIAPLEVRLFPARLEQGVAVTVRPEIVGGDPAERPRILLAGTLPPGLDLRHKALQSLITGVPRRVGEYSIHASAIGRSERRDTTLTLFVDPPNYARTANQIIAAVAKPRDQENRDVEILRDGLCRGPFYDSSHGQSRLEEDFYGYMWPQPLEIGRLVFTTGESRENGGWFETLQAQYLDNRGQWAGVAEMEIAPVFTAEAARKESTRFALSFKPVKTTGIRIIGKPGGTAAFTAIAELAVYAR